MICPNCGKTVDSSTEICPHCSQPTQFSSRMRYYPRSTPLQSESSPTYQTTAENGDTQTTAETEKAQSDRKDKGAGNKKALIAVSCAGIILLIVFVIVTALLSGRIARDAERIEYLEQQMQRQSTGYGRTDKPMDEDQRTAAPASVPETTETPAPTPESTETPSLED